MVFHSLLNIFDKDELKYVPLSCVLHIHLVHDATYI